MTRTLPQGPALPSEEELSAQLAALAEGAPGAVELLDQLSRAIFPDGATRRQLTWDEPREGPAPRDAHASLSALQARFRTLVEQIPAVTFLAVLGEGENDVYVSPHIERMLGFSQQEWLENPFLWYWQMHPDDRATWNVEFGRGLRTGGPFVAECRFFARDGRVVWVRGEARLVRDSLGRPQFLQGVAFDITDAKRAQHMLLQAAVRDAKRQKELEVARRVQTSIVPRDFAVPGLDIAAAMEPADEVGGDYYDVIPFPGGAYIAIGDVSGHGIDAGLIMLMVQSAALAILSADSTRSPREALGLLGAILYDNIRKRLGQDDYVTLSLFRYCRDGHVVFAGAHEDVVLVRAATGAVERIPTPGMWLAAKRDIREGTKESRFQLRHGDLLVLYTDGVTEARSAEGALFDLGGLVSAVLEVKDRAPADIRDHVLSRVRSFRARQDDDVSLFVARYTAEGAT